MSRSCIIADWGMEIEMHTSWTRRARKTHTCGECREQINVGDLYEVSEGRADGEWVTDKTCARCCNVRSDYFRSWVYGSLVEDFEAEHGFDYRDGIPADFTPCGEAQR